MRVVRVWRERGVTVEAQGGWGGVLGWEEEKGDRESGGRVGVGRVIWGAPRATQGGSWGG
mgnify:CR=1 FL=1